MPLIGPLTGAQLRRNWQVVVATVAFVAFLLGHFLVFQPAARRYQKALKTAADLGLAFDPEQPIPMMPPRVLALVTENSLPASAAGMESESGALTAALLEDLTQLTAQNGIQVIATEPGVTSREAKAIQVRAHLSVQCSYGEFVAFLDALSRSRKLTSVDRFGIMVGAADHHNVDLWVTRYILRQNEGRKS